MLSKHTRLENRIKELEERIKNLEYDKERLIKLLEELLHKF